MITTGVTGRAVARLDHAVGRDRAVGRRTAADAHARLVRRRRRPLARARRRADRSGSAGSTAHRSPRRACGCRDGDVVQHRLLVRRRRRHHRRRDHQRVDACRSPIAFSHRDVMTERPIVDVPIEGIELPADGVRAAARPSGDAADRHRHDGAARRSASRPACRRRPRWCAGWSAVTERAEPARAARRRARGVARRAGHRRALRAGARCGCPTPATIRRRSRSASTSWCGWASAPTRGCPIWSRRSRALARRAGWAATSPSMPPAARWRRRASSRAVRDLERIVVRARTAHRRPGAPPDGVLWCPWLESRLLTGERCSRPASRRTGSDSRSRSTALPAGRRPTSVAFAVRWHGARPAVLWEQTGEPVELTAPCGRPVGRPVGDRRGALAGARRSLVTSAGCRP